MTQDALDRLARRYGILNEYWQIDGTHRPCKPETAVALLAGMGIDASTESATAESLANLEAGDTPRPFPREILVTADTRSRHNLPDWRIRLESGACITCDPKEPDRIPALPAGVHTLQTADHRALVIASPTHAPSVLEKTGTNRIWGLWTSLYGQRSARNLGVGDYEDLACLAEAMAPSGAAFVGVNPVHARGLDRCDISPYSPSSRTALDTGHIAVDRIPEFAVCPRARALLEAAAPALSQARASLLVDRTIHNMIAEDIMRALFDTFESDGGEQRRAAFETWRRSRDPEEARQSVFAALCRRHGPEWRHWPAALQDPDSPDVVAFAGQNGGEIRYDDWQQWIATTQIAEAQRRARKAGMPIGLYLDIAVGVHPGGAETWARRTAFATGISLGAPPDLLNAQGQRWNLASFSPPGLAADDYLPFRRMLRNTMAAAGLVRIDHVIGLKRSFWVPDNGAEGGYVTFPTDILLALVRIEAQRAGCLVVGEDLGTVPEGLREGLTGSGLYSYSIMGFERSDDGLTPPAHYRRHSLASFGTHDLPPLAGWWQGRDIETRAALGHISGDLVGREWDARHRDRIQFCRRLAEAGRLPEGVDPEAPPGHLDAALRDAIHALLADSGAELVALGLDDIFAVTDQQNIPSTVKEAPNWRRRAPVAVENLADSTELRRTATIMNAARPGSPTADRRRT